MEVVLVVFRTGAERLSVSLARDMSVIGRGEDCDLRIPVLEVSRRHCRIMRDGDILKLEDLGSSNGTYLNGKRIREAALSAGDRIYVRPVTFIVQIDGEPPEKDMRPGPPPAPGAPRAGGESGLEADAGMPAPYDPMADFAMEDEKDEDDEVEADPKIDFNFDSPTEKLADDDESGS